METVWRGHRQDQEVSDKRWKELVESQTEEEEEDVTTKRRKT